jgi:hypothetical protein
MQLIVYIALFRAQPSMAALLRKSSLRGRFSAEAIQEILKVACYE